MNRFMTKLLKGENFDGSHFWSQALDNGADAVVIENIEIMPEDLQQYANKTKQKERLKKQDSLKLIFYAQTTP